MNEDSKATEKNESCFGSFKDLLNEAYSEEKSIEGKIVSGKIISLLNDSAVIDVGFKSEGRVPLKDIINFSQIANPKAGDVLDVFIERLENRNGEIVLSVEKARKETIWRDLQEAYEEERFVDGFIFGKVKGGFAVNIKGSVAFLPGSQVDLRSIKDIQPLVDVVQPFKILKVDRLRNNIVVSRRAALLHSRDEAKLELMSRLEEGQVMQGVVKNITDYGAFVDLGGTDGLLHVTDISWKRVNHPSDALKVGSLIDVMVLKFNKESGRISLGMKQIGPDPWKDADKRYIVGQKYKGAVVSITDYGAFVELYDGVEGLIYVTELSWTKRNIHPSNVLTIGQEVEVIVLEVDPDKKRLSLGLKQCTENPWSKFKEDFPINSIVEGIVRNVTEFGIFVSVAKNNEDDMDGMIHLSDVSWDKDHYEAASKYQRGQTIKVKVLDINPERERISLGIKQLTEDPFEKGIAEIKKDQTINGIVEGVKNQNLVIKLPSGIYGIIKRNDLSRDRSDNNLNNFPVGSEIEAKVIGVDRFLRKILLSIRALEVDTAKSVLAEESQDSRVTLEHLIKEAMEEKEN